MVKDNDDGQQPMKPSPHKPGRPKENTYGESAADKKPEGGRTKYDKPAVGADDFATDEQRDKRIRGNESSVDGGEKKNEG
ncbi:hypothetical protein JSE7799_01832 [Jannaschia seosinensis]|uniref:Uncharacterized protein n=1 Tax=Jannaschia seosinensis TaxID=313367 RepID=A0A0M7B9R2_9RHOB|nr:hypothetical protein [Jannaschia seosinensis]CUH39111.1 hypothetical protein JSE7799_01832 [Jannaschia seosinensis]